MREMLILVIAVFIPPTLTYFGFIGGGAEPVETELQAPAEPARSQSDSTRQTWYESSL